MWFFLALLSGFCAAVIAVLVKLYLKHINPFFITFLFSLIALIAFFIADVFTQKIDCKLIISLTSKEWIPLLIAGILNGLAFVFYLSALKCGRTGSVIAIDRLGIVFALILAAFFLQESFSVKTILGSLIMVIGAFLMAT